MLLRLNINQATFGSPMSNRSFNANSSRYGFGNKEKDDEIKGSGNSYNFEARINDPRLGRWLSVDPLTFNYPFQSSYCSMDNNPVFKIDPTGKGTESTHLDKTGKVLRKFNDGDDGVYVHKDGTTANDVDKSYVKNGTSAGGSKIGEIGKTIDANKIYTNLLTENAKEAKGIINPFTFRNYVKNKGKWDLKQNKNTIYGLANDGKTKFLFQGKEMESQDIGNHHFGVVGEAYGVFSQDFMLQQAGEAQISAGTSKPEWQKTMKVTKTEYLEHGMKNTVTEIVKLPPYGDDPRDQAWIKEGFEYYKNMKK